MEFKHVTQKTTYEKVGQWMRELFGGVVHVRQDAPVYGVRFGSAFVQVSISPWGENEAIITTRSYVVYGANLREDLLKYLLRKNDEMRFGAFALDGDGDIVFSHTIVGSTCQKEELKASVYAVMKVADQYDDEIVGRWGGERALDRML